MDFRNFIINKYSQIEEIEQFRKDALRGLFWWEINLLRKYVRAGQKVLVLGCGAGREVFGIAKSGIFTCGLDICMAQLRSAKFLREKNKWPGVFLACDALQLGIKGGSFDICVMFRQFIQHIPFRHNRKMVLKEIFRILKPGGMLLLSLHIKPFSIGPQRVANYIYKKFLQKGQSISRVKSAVNGSAGIFKKIIFVVLGSVIAGISNCFRGIRKQILGRRYKGLEPGDFFITAVSRARSAGKVLFHDYSLKEIVTELSDAGYEILLIRDIYELETGSECPLFVRSGAPFICISAKKPGFVQRAT